ncbi:MAG: hypothetical protein KAI43_13810 [Candidatus Aureabacteria bacterium]|nr:hypothetical protein [Candidatus Auribacterota bacterium]
MIQNRRKLFTNTRTRWVFTIFILFSIIVAFIFLGWTFIINFFDEHIYDENAEVFNYALHHGNVILLLKTILLLCWVGFSSFSAYIYLENKYNGIFARIDRLFNDISSGQEKQLFFRDGDSFAYIAESFNRMVSNLKTGTSPSQKDKVSAIIKKAEELMEKDSDSKDVLAQVVSELKELV